MTLNFYYENIPAGRYLKAKLRFYGMIPKANFKIVKPFGMPNQTFDMISTHYEKLELLKRFSKNSNEVFSEARLRVKRDCQGLTVVEIRNLLLSEAQLWSRLIQENFWKVALYEAMANSPQFVEQCFVNL